MLLKGSSEMVTALGQGGISPEIGEERQLQESVVHHIKESLAMNYSSILKNTTQLNRQGSYLEEE